MFRVTIPAAMLDGIIARLVRGAERVEITGAIHDEDFPEFIACDSSPPRGIRGLIVLEEKFAHPSVLSVPDDVRLVLELGREARLGRARAWRRDAKAHGGWIRGSELFLPGPRMVRVALGPATNPTPREAAENERWSRTRGALGSAAHDRLRSLRVGIAGLGRLGCVLARNFAGLGVRALALMDPDSVELHNTGEGGFFGEGDIGQPKVHAWENWLAVHHPEIEVNAIAASVSLAVTQRALSGCDLVVSAADHPAARLMAAATATAYSRPLIDVGTQVLPTGGEITMGLDVRFIFPSRCLLCLGGVGPDEAVARHIIESPDFERAFTSGRDGLAERPGSLDSLNQLAAAHAMRLLEEGLLGRLTGHTWRREEFTLDGHSAGTYLTPAPRGGPCFCQFAGWGTAAAPHLLEILDERAALVAQSSSRP